MSSTPAIAAPPRPDDFLDWVHLFSRSMNPSDEAVLTDVLRVLFPDARTVQAKGLAQGWSRAAYRVEVDGQVMFGKHLPADASDLERAAFAHHVACLNGPLSAIWHPRFWATMPPRKRC